MGTNPRRTWMVSFRPHWPLFATTVIHYPLVAKPFGGPEVAISAAYKSFQFLQIINVVTTQVLPSPLAKSRERTQQVKDSHPHPCSLYKSR